MFLCKKRGCSLGFWYNDSAAGTLRYIMDHFGDEVAKVFELKISWRKRKIETE